MLELSNPVKTQAATTPEVSRFLQSERKRDQQSAERHQQEDGFSVKKLMRTLQNRFSHTGDISSEIEKMVEDQVQKRTRELFRQANYDALTHLPNRSYFNATVEQLVIKAQEANSEFSLLFLDLDGFKSVNDTLGHQAGDELLRNVGARLMSAVREGDIVSRLGGDEFVILLSDVEDKELIKGVCQRIIDEVSLDYWIDGNDVAVSTSIGIARFPFDGKTSSELVERADQALYVSKHSGKRTFRFYDEISSQLMTPKHELKNRLEAAIEKGTIEAVFEPQVDLASNQIVGATISAKWQESELATPYLASWTDMLNDGQSAYSVGSWLIDSGLYYVKQWQKLNDSMVVSIPVLDAMWQKQDLVMMLNQRLTTYQLQPSQVQLEFSLETLNKNPDLHLVMNGLAASGFQITLSEVGKSPLDLSLMSHLNLQELKLNREWLNTTMQSEKGQKWVKALVQMAKSLDLCVIATGIENAEKAQQVQLQGCSMAQGRFWSEPVDSASFNLMLKQELRVVA